MQSAKSSIINAAVGKIVDDLPGECKKAKNKKKVLAEYSFNVNGVIWKMNILVGLLPAMLCLILVV